MPPQAKADEVRERAIKVYRYVIRGIRAPEIARLENLPHRQVNWYIEEGGRILGGELRLLAKRGILRELFYQYQEIRKELWFTYSSAKTVRERAVCLRQLVELGDRFLDLAERLGLVTQKPLLLEGHLSWSDIVALANQDDARKRPRLEDLH
jgi:hypothetical protein